MQRAPFLSGGIYKKFMERSLFRENSPLVLWYSVPGSRIHQVLTAPPAGTLTKHLLFLPLYCRGRVSFPAADQKFRLSGRFVRLWGGHLFFHWFFPFSMLYCFIIRPKSSGAES